MSPLYIVTFSLLLFPILGLIFGYLTRNKPILRRAIVYPILIIASIAIIAGVFGLSTTHIGLDLILYSSFYFSLSLGLWYIFFKKSRILAAFLMFIIFLSGYLFSLALPFSNDLIPKVSIQIDDNLIYKESTLAAKYGAKQIEIFKTYANIFEKRIFSKTYTDQAPALINDTLTISYNPQKGELILSIPKEQDKYMYTFHEKFDSSWTDTLQIQ